MSYRTNVLLAGKVGSGFDTVNWESLNCRVTRVSDAEDLILRLERECPDVVFLDTDLPAADGLRLASLVKQTDPKAGLVPVTACCAFGPVQEAMKLGVAGYLIKPCSGEEILGVMEDLLTQERKTNEPADLIQECMSYIRVHYREKITIRRVAEKLQCSPWRITKQLTESGSNFREMVNRVRIEEAIRLMACPDRLLSEIACEVGYTDGAQFSHVFRQQMGITPRQYRRNLLLERKNGPQQPQN